MRRIYISMLLLYFSFTTTLHAQFPEGFESGFPPVGWVTFIGANGLGTSQNWKSTSISQSGTSASFVRYENVSGGIAEDWLVTPQFIPTSSSNLLSFYQRQSYTTNYGSTYSIRVSLEVKQIKVTSWFWRLKMRQTSPITTL